MQVTYGWDLNKAAANKSKHGVSFEDACGVFDDPHHVVMENHYIADDGEQRHQAIGLSKGLLVLLVVFVERHDNRAIVLRLISARKANSYEQQIYRDASG